MATTSAQWTNVGSLRTVLLCEIATWHALALLLLNHGANYSFLVNKYSWSNETSIMDIVRGQHFLDMVRLLHNVGAKDVVECLKPQNRSQVK